MQNKGKSVRFGLRLSEPTYRRVQARAQAQGKSVNTLVADIIRDALNTEPVESSDADDFEKWMIEEITDIHASTQKLEERLNAQDAQIKWLATLIPQIRDVIRDTPPEVIEWALQNLRNLGRKRQGR
jgi:hypothetical protein